MKQLTKKQKIQITEAQAEQFNLMLRALKRIAKDYQPTEKLRKNPQREWGLDYEELLEMAYDNIQAEAAMTINKIKPLKYENETRQHTTPKV